MGKEELAKPSARMKPRQARLSCKIASMFCWTGLVIGRDQSKVAE